jgi:hypothetical protein
MCLRPQVKPTLSGPTDIASQQTWTIDYVLRENGDITVFETSVLIK